MLRSSKVYKANENFLRLYPSELLDSGSPCIKGRCGAFILGSHKFEAHLPICSQAIQTVNSRESRSMSIRESRSMSINVNQSSVLGCSHPMYKHP